MATSYTFILRECPAPAKAAIAQFLGKAFSLKDSTCASIADSAPIILLPDLNPDEAAAMHLALSGLVRLGAVTELATGVGDDLPKIDWPRRPQIFKRDVADHVADLALQVPGPQGPTTLLQLVSQTAGLAGAKAAPPPERSGTDPVITPAHATRPAEFRGIQLPEITPFGGAPTLPPTPMPATKPPTSSSNRQPMARPPAGEDDALSRLNELFPEDESSGFLPNNSDITSILDRLLPDEDASSGSNTPSSGSSNRMAATSGLTGHSVFLAKIADEGRRLKAAELIAEMAKISSEEADALSKKVIIPVLKGATKDEAEAAKARFAKIGILARIKAPDQG
jgi:hypothetical protein